jgi:hydrogenase expression/formation protein HypE
VALVAGDTKVVERGKGDGMFINTAGLGLLPEGLELVPSRMSPGDVVILSGPVGEHGIAVMAERNGLSFEPPLRSDTRPLNDLVQKMLQAGEGLKVLRDPTRGGLATTLKELALQSGLNILVREEDIPVSPQVRGAAELLGLDPLYVACEGVLVAVAGAPVAEYLLALMREHPDGVQARAIGEVLPPEGSEPRVVLQTAIGGQRMLEMLLAEQLPRIC